MTEEKKKKKTRQEIEVAVREKVDCEEKAFRWVEQLALVDSISQVEFKKMINEIMVNHYNDIVEERACSKVCGYPLCSVKLGKRSQHKYHVSMKYNKVIDLSVRENFCTLYCFRASKFIEEQIPTEPIWLRKNRKPVELKLLPREKGKQCNVNDVGEVSLGITNIDLSDIENPSKQSLHKKKKKERKISDSSSSSSNDDEYPNEDYCFESDKEVGNNNNHSNGPQGPHGPHGPQGPQVRSNSNPQKTLTSHTQGPQGPQIRSNGNPQKTLTSDKQCPQGHQGPQGPQGPQVRSNNNPQKTLTGHKQGPQVPQGPQIRSNGNAQKTLTSHKQAKLIDQKDIVKKESLKKGEGESDRYLSKIKPTLKEWFTSESYRHLYALQKDSSDSDDTEDEGSWFPESDDLGVAKFLSRQPEWVSEAYIPAEPKQEHNTKETSKKKFVLPTVDSRSQSSIRRRIVHEKLASSLREILPLCGLLEEDLTQVDFFKLVDTFNFTSKNIVLNSKHWTITTIVLILSISRIYRGDFGCVKNRLKDINDFLVLRNLPNISQMEETIKMISEGVVDVGKSEENVINTDTNDNCKSAKKEQVVVHGNTDTNDNCKAVNEEEVVHGNEVPVSYYYDNMEEVD